MKFLLTWVVVLLLQRTLRTGAQDCPAVEFVDHPQDMNATLGDTNVRLHCSVDDGGLFNWEHYLSNGTRWTIIDDRFQDLRGFTIDTSNGDLMISVVQSFHAGLYSCYANRPSCSEESNNATFIVNGRPEIIFPTQRYCVDTLQTLNITGLVTGFPLPSGAQLLNATSGDVITNERFIISLDDTTLTIMVRRVQVSDGGSYRVNASNSLGGSSEIFQIETKGPDPPQIMVQSTVIFGYNDAVNVACSVQATASVSEANLTMVWIDPQGREMNSSSDRTELTLSIASLQNTHIGTYRCSANNTRGVNSRNTTIYGPLSPVQAPVIQAGSNPGSFRIMWNHHPAFTTFNITYRIYVFREGTGEVVRIRQVVNDTETVVQGLSAGRYEVHVVANAGGVTGVAGNTSTFVVEGENDNTQIIASAVGAGAGVLVLIVIGGAIGIFFLCFYYPHRRKMQSQQRTWSKEEDDGEVVNNYTTLTLHPSIELPPSPESVMVSSIFSTEIDPKWEFPRENIQLSEVLHEGQFTVLYKGVAKGIREKPMDIAVKAVKDDATEDDVKLLIAEMEQLSGLGQHPNIVSLIRVCTVGKPLYMVMEYMCHGDLLGFLRCSRGHQSMFTISPGIHNQPPSLSLSSRDIITIATKIANGMRYLADRKIVHRALCARNVLVGTSMDIKIYNVGAFDLTFDSRELMKWMAPETLFDSTTTTCSDVWSFGVTLWELVTVGGSPYAEILPEDLYTQLHSGMRMPKPPHCAQEVYDIMNQCWQKNPTDRPHFAVIHEKLSGLASSKMSFLDLRNYNGTEYSQFEDYPQLSTAL